MIRLLRYRVEPVSLRPSSTRAGHAASALATQIRRAAPELAPEHIGSSAVPGLAGKGYLDLQAAVAPERMHAVADDLACAGWQRQDGARRFPPERPMLRAALDYQGERFQAHLHLIPADWPELHDNRSFRDWLAADATLRARYEGYKRAIVAAGIRDGVAYGDAKSEFVVAALRILGRRDG